MEVQDPDQADNEIGSANLRARWVDLVGLQSAVGHDTAAGEIFGGVLM